MALAEVNADHAAALAELNAAYGRTIEINGKFVTATVHTRAQTDELDDIGSRETAEAMTVTAATADFTEAEIAAMDKDGRVILEGVTYRITTGQVAHTDEILSITCKQL